MKYYLSLFLLFALFLQGCNEENSLNTIEFYWGQTGCSDPWKTNANNSNKETQRAVEEYLSDQGVKGATVISIHWR